MAFLMRKRTLLIIFFVIVLIFSIYLIFTENHLKVFHKVKPETYDIKKVSNDSQNGKDEVASKNISLRNKENDFFIDYKLERDRLRSQEADYLRELINNPNATQQSKDKAQEDLICLSQKVEKEMIVENLIKAKGFEDSVLFLSENSADVVVKTDKLSQKDVAQISDIVTKTTEIPMDKITLIERK